MGFVHRPWDLPPTPAPDHLRAQWDHLDRALIALGLQSPRSLPERKRRREGTTSGATTHGGNP